MGCTAAMWTFSMRSNYKDLVLSLARQPFSTSVVDPDVPGESSSAGADASAIAWADAPSSGPKGPMTPRPSSTCLQLWRPARQRELSKKREAHMEMRSLWRWKRRRLRSRRRAARILGGGCRTNAGPTFR